MLFVEESELTISAVFRMLCLGGVFRSVEHVGHRAARQEEIHQGLEAIFFIRIHESVFSSLKMDPIRSAG